MRYNLLYIGRYLLYDIMPGNIAAQVRYLKGALKGDSIDVIVDRPFHGII